jgi:hypothetical protein
MRQIASLILFNILLSFLLFLVTAIVLIRLIPAGRLLYDSDLRHKEYKILQAKYGDPLGGMRRVLWLLTFVCFPMIAVAIGTVSGMMSKAQPVPIALLGSLPFEVFMLSFSKLRIRDILPPTAYAVIACVVAFVIFHSRIASP